MDAAAVWRLAPRQQLARRCWDDECVVFNDVTGDSHLLGAEAVTILLHLATQPATEHSLQLLFGPALAPEDQQDFEQLLHQLGKLNLIEPCPT